MLPTQTTSTPTATRATSVSRAGSKARSSAAPMPLRAYHPVPAARTSAGTSSSRPGSRLPATTSPLPGSTVLRPVSPRVPGSPRARRLPPWRLGWLVSVIGVPGGQGGPVHRSGLLTVAAGPPLRGGSAPFARVWRGAPGTAASVNSETGWYPTAGHPGRTTPQPPQRVMPRKVDVHSVRYHGRGGWGPWSLRGGTR
jgi:hypothetical protein